LQEPLPDSYLQAFAAIQADPHQFLAVMEHQGQIIGTLQLTFIPGLSRQGSWRAQVEAVRIQDRFRNQGLGQHLMRWAIARAKAQGCRMVQLTTDKSRSAAQRFYERLGFVSSHEGMKLNL
jgi:ribosomal protein S18 acetylase RimI-like enzyme